MRLGLSSAAAPDAPFAELLAACVRRGLAAVELRSGDAHGVVAGAAGGAAARERAAAAGVAISGFRSASAVEDCGLAPLASAADAPVLVDGGPCDARILRAADLANGGGEVAVVVDELDFEEVRRLVARGFDLAWNFPIRLGAAAGAERLLSLAGRRLRHVRVAGGGPESDLHDGHGVGALMRTLALAGYDGSVILAPSSPRYHVAWTNWLGRRGGWGCGSKADRSLVRLGGMAAEAGMVAAREAQ